MANNKELMIKNIPIDDNINNLISELETRCINGCGIPSSLLIPYNNLLPIPLNDFIIKAQVKNINDIEIQVNDTGFKLSDNDFQALYNHMMNTHNEPTHVESSEIIMCKLREIEEMMNNIPYKDESDFVQLLLSAKCRMGMNDKN